MLHRAADKRQSGIYAETVQAAVPSYQPNLPSDRPLGEYLDDLIAQARAGLTRSDRAGPEPRTNR